MNISLKPLLSLCFEASTTQSTDVAASLATASGPDSWAVVNFVIVAASIVIALVLMLMFFLRPQPTLQVMDALGRRHLQSIMPVSGQPASTASMQTTTLPQEAAAYVRSETVGTDSYDPQKCCSDTYRSFLWRTLGLVVATIAFVTFLVTENIEAVPTAFDDWTPFTVILFMLQLLFVYAALMKSPEKREADRALKGIQRRTRIRYE